MGTYNGVGTMYYGWRHQPDETSTATLWITVFYFPIVPIRRHRLRVLTDFDQDGITGVELAGYLLSGGRVVAQENDHFEITDRTGLALREILKTYAKAYLLLPVLLTWPLLLFYGGFQLLRAYPALKNENWPMYVMVAMMAAYFGYICAVILGTLKRARGFRGGMLE